MSAPANNSPATPQTDGPSAPVVDVSGLGRTFDVSKPWLNRVLERKPRALLKAAQDISFTIGRGETFALVGESGSGKSTVAKMVVGLLAASTGTIRIDGVDMRQRAQTGAEMRDLRRRIQMIFQDPYASLNPRWRVDRIIAEPIRAFKLESSEAAISKRVGELLELVRLHPRDGAKYPHEFSGGQRQRICIARALSSEPKLIVCDEPTSALDVSVQAEVLNLLVRLQKEKGFTYLMVSHDLAVVDHMCDRFAIMQHGRIVEVLDRAAITGGGATQPYARELIGASLEYERAI